MIKVIAVMDNGKKTGKSSEENFDFQVRPAYIKQSSGKPGLLYAEYFYVSKGKEDGATMEHLFKENSPSIVVEKAPLKDRLKEENVYSFQAYDVNNNPVKSGYNSKAELAIISNAYRKGANKSTSISCGNKTCANASLDFVNGVSTENSIYTDQANNKSYLKFDNAGKTSLYGVDNSFANNSRNAGTCIENSTSNVRNANGLVGCDVGFKGKATDYIEFHTYKPAVFKVVYNLFNSPANGSYGSKKFTYRHSINDSNSNFENGKIIVHAYAIGASEYSFRNSIPLSLYDANNYEEAEYVEAAGSPKAPRVTYSNNSSNRDLTKDLALSLQVKEKGNYGLYEIKENSATKIAVNNGKADIKRLAKNYFFGDNNSTYAINFDTNNLQQNNMLVVNDKNVLSVDFDVNALAQMGASAASSVIDSITFVDVAMLSPNIANAISKGNNSKADVFLAGICSGGACGDLFGSNVPGYKNEKTFNFSVINDTKDGKEAVFNYKGANRKDTKNSLDVIEVKNNVVQVLLKGGNEEAYCSIIRGCRKLGDGKYGIEFSASGDNGKTWHGEGEGQGKTAVDNDDMRSNNNRLVK